MSYNTITGWKLAGLVAGAAASISILVWYRRKNRIPKEWVKVASVSDLYLYPIKSCKGIRQSSIECTQLGPKVGELRDRMFVVVTEGGEFVTGREYPKLTQVVASVSDGKIKISAAAIPEKVEFDLRNLSDYRQEVRIWKAAAEGIDCGDDVAIWLSRFILLQDKGLRLLYYGDRNVPKEMNPNMAKAINFTKKDFRKTDSSLFSDAAAYHLISDTSVKELNSRLEDETVSSLNFRPNVVIRGEGLIPFEEDKWDWIKIGGVVFRYLSPCGRCLFTTINPETTEKSQKSEPVSTLRKYRLSRDPAERAVFQSPTMGIYLGARSFGFISVGDDVMIPAP